LPTALEGYRYLLNSGCGTENHLGFPRCYIIPSLILFLGGKNPPTRKKEILARCFENY